MEIIITDSFTKSLEKLANSFKFYRIEYWSEKYYNLKWNIKNLFTYFKIVIQTRPWDYCYMLQMMRFQINLLKQQIESPHSLQECDGTRIPKIEKMNRVIELLSNIIDDNFAERSGYDSDASTDSFIKNEDSNTYLMKTEIIKEGYNLSEIFKKARELEKEETDELFSLMRNEFRGWWQ